MVNGKIELITGPMGSGKSEELVRRLTRHSIAKRNVLLIRPTKDTRSFLTRSGLILYPDIVIKFLDELPEYNLIRNYDVIGVDEAQFFNNINLSNYYADNDKLVILSSVSFHPDLSFFDPIIHLYPDIEDVTTLKSVCEDCGDEASFTIRLTEDKSEISVGTDQYKAVCRKCRKKYK